MRTYQLLKPTLFLSLFSVGLYISAQDNPVADKAAVVVQGNARFTVLTDMLIRLEYNTDAGFTDNASLTFVNRKLPVPVYSTTHVDGWLVIKTAHLQLKYKENSGKFNAHNLQIEYYDSLKDDHSVVKFSWHPGQKDKQNLKGTTRTLDGASGKFTFLKMKKLPIEDGILSRSGWALIDDSERPLFDNSDWQWVQERDKNEVQDLYFFGYGSNYKRAMFDFVSTSGKISMPPKFAFGIWYSRYWNYTEQELKDIVTDYEKNNIPLDVLVVDMDWHLTEKSSPEIFKDHNPKLNGWTGFTWEKKYFPDYKEFLKWTDDRHIQTCLNLHPAAGVQHYEDAYPAFAKAMGVDTSKHASILFDITNKKFAQAYFNVLLHPYEKAGIDFWWLDWQQWGSTNMKGVNPTFYLNYLHYSDMQRQGKRPLIFHRYGGLGNQRYQIGFSGDYFINWKSLAYQPEFTLTAANVGFGYWSHDIGGHMNIGDKRDKQDPELFTRWVEWGAFSPIFRTHATKDPDIERRIWKYPDANFKAMRTALQQRYALLPYIYTYARLAYDSGISLVHPMYYEYPQLEQAYQCASQYYFGNDMIVAPITASMKGKESIVQKVWLPEGTWYDYRDNDAVKGGGIISQTYKLDEVPVFVKAGSIIPTQNAKLRIEGSLVDTINLTVYPQWDAAKTLGKAEFTMYEDDGTSENYKQYAYSYTHFTFEKNEKGARVLVEPDDKSFDGQPANRSYTVNIVGVIKPGAVKVNGKKVIEGEEWSYDDSRQVLTVHTTRKKIAKVVIAL